jgi:hypothetical protein
VRSPNGRWLGSVLLSALLCAVAWVVATFMVGAVTEANLLMDPAAPWFLIPAILVNAITLFLGERWFVRRIIDSPPHRYLDV